MRFCRGPSCASIPACARAPGRTLVPSSVNGRDWSAPRVAFPEIHLPAFSPPPRYFRGDGRVAFGNVPLQDNVIEFRSGAWRQDVPWPIQKGEPGSPGVYREDLPGADTPVAEAVYYIDDVRTSALP